jgi:hypothetical protein
LTNPSNVYLIFTSKLNLLDIEPVKRDTIKDMPRQKYEEIEYPPLPEPVGQTELTPMGLPQPKPTGFKKDSQVKKKEGICYCKIF